MAAAAEVQTLLRFLSTDCKVPLATAIPKISELRNTGLNSPENISKSDVGSLTSIFSDEKLAKQIFNAAKRISSPKKRPLPSTAIPPASKRSRDSPTGNNSSDPEDGLILPVTDAAEDELLKTTIQTNRAPLVLAFAVVLLKYTSPEQPLSSRLSLGQALVSANSQSKARAIGLQSSRGAEEEGWAQGQPKIRIMGREIAVMRRVGFQSYDASLREDSQKTVDGGSKPDDAHLAFWGLDLEALRKSNGPLIVGKNANGSGGLPIYSPQAARSYLLKSFDVVAPEAQDVKRREETVNSDSPPKKKPSTSQAAAKKGEAAGLLLKAIDMLYESWTSTLGKDELDRRAWSWYLHVRPDVAQGQAGWGQKGVVRLEDILNLRRKG